MNTQHLKYAVEVEKTGSITKAAEKLYMNQPHLSKTIRELEEMLGVTIFKRTPKGMLPTKKGAEFLAYAKNILAQLDKMENLLAQDNPQKLTFNIAVPRASYVSYAFTEFLKKLPEGKELDINYRETNSVRTIRDVADAENDLGIIRCQREYENYFINVLEEKDLEFIEICRFEYLVLFSEKHPLAQEEIVDCEKLAGYIEITHGDSSIPSLPLQKGGARKSFGTDATKKEISVYERGSQLELLNRIPTTYMWVSPMPQEVLSMFSLVQRKCDSRNCHKDLLIFRKDYVFTDEDKAFIERLNETVNSIPLFNCGANSIASACGL